MANNKISYAGLKLKTKIEKEIVDFEDNKIEVYSYLPIEDKFEDRKSTRLNSSHRL